MRKCKKQFGPIGQGLARQKRFFACEVELDKTKNIVQRITYSFLLIERFTGVETFVLHRRLRHSQGMGATWTFSE